MATDQNPSVEKVIKDYIELRDVSRQFEKKRNDLEKEYNKLLTAHNGEAKNFNLDQADKIYSVYCEMLAYQEKSKVASESFLEAEHKLREIGNILYDATIHAEISFPAINGTEAHTRSVMVIYNNGQVQIH